MAYARQLPLWRAAMDLAVHLEQAVRRFPRHHKYTLGNRPAPLRSGCAACPRLHRLHP
ncbi:hypothetical protein [Ottowia sp.]|uniref:hypothetical protein n=1 Tax=Ottowia sp. TaxID=1898956 RepID=UPI0025DC5AD1|nr:hypothetical protein [Ottowia sp.]MBK6615709.1 hypothetical protein [Ottowia sp.]MBK6747453.1 hypothetical protein [Ottowia sp.]